MPDFTSSLFLGLTQPVRMDGDLPLTTGRPAGAGESPAARTVVRALNRGVGAAAGLVHRSTLHALTDVVGTVARDAARIVVDAAVYPIADTAVLAAATRADVPVVHYRHLHAADTARLSRGTPGPVVIVTDGWCSGCLQPAPLPALATLAGRTGGVLVVDDTQALGVLGTRSPGDDGFGHGGGGTLRWLGGRPDWVLQVSSLAKAYGAPLAVTLGPARWIRRLAVAPLRWQASPPTTVDLAVATAVLGHTADHDDRRRYLHALVLRLRAGLRRCGLTVVGLPFPVVSVSAGDAVLARLEARWQAAGIRALLVRPRCRPRPVLSLLLTAAHHPDDVDRVVRVTADRPRGWAA